MTCKRIQCLEQLIQSLLLGLLVSLMEVPKYKGLELTQIWQTIIGKL